MKPYEDYNKVIESPSVEIFKENGLLGIKDNSREGTIVLSPSYNYIAPLKDNNYIIEKEQRYILKQDGS